MGTGSDNYVLGIDYGTDSCRLVVVDTKDGVEIAHSVAAYPRWSKGLYCNPSRNQFRQHPQDFIDAMIEASAILSAKVGFAVLEKVRGLAIDTTGSTPCAVDRNFMPLSLHEPFESDPDAMFILWKDHTSVEEAEAINRTARTWGGIDYTKFEGGNYSSEWFWAKIAHVVSTNPKVAAASYSFLEHCDWMPALLCGIAGEGSNSENAAIKRSRCVMGHKAMWHKDFGGYPEDAFLARIHPILPEIKKTLGVETYPSDVVFGTLCQDWASRLHLPAGIPVAVGALDAHMGAVGGGAEKGVLIKVMGTSTCDMIVGPQDTAAGTPHKEHLVQGICGQVDGSIIPGLLGYEAGQSAFGDVYAWFRNLLSWPLDAVLKRDPGLSAGECGGFVQEIKDQIMTLLEEEASKIAPEHLEVIALDWLNGRRTPDANQKLKAAIANLSLGVDAPALYRSLIEATAFGSRAIVERFEIEGVPIERIRAIGGVARKSRLVMQIVADVLGKPIEIVSSDQSVALGAAIFASVAAGIYTSVSKAQQAMKSPIEHVVMPNTSTAEAYNKKYRQYLKLGTLVEKGSLEPS
jgi:L-ribulokinase